MLPIPRFLLFLIGRVVRRPVLRHINAFEEATHRCREVQEALLRRIVARHSDTDFGRQHHFASIRTAADFQKQLPVAGYDYFEPYIERVRKGELRALLGDDKVHMFALTSGTTAARKYIPVTEQYLADYKRAWNIWGLRAYRAHNSVRLRPIVQMSSDCEEFKTEAGIPCGSVTGLTAKMQKRIIKFLYCVPACVARIKDIRAKYYTVLRLSMARNPGFVLAANPSTLINLAKAGDHEKEALIRDIHNGTLREDLDLPADVRLELKRALKRDPKQARRLDALASQHGQLYPLHYWTDCLLGCWTGGSMGAYLQHFPKYYGEQPVRDVGLIASEGRFTIPFTDSCPAGVLDITSHYFEFLPEEEAESAQPRVLAAHEVEEGKKYFILPTTAFGLYRYNIYDLVRVTGFHNGTPLVEFLSKGSHFSSITGEKLSEYHVTHSMRDVLRERGLSLTSYSVAPCWDDEQPYYGLFVEEGDFDSPLQAEQLADALDQRLSLANIEYACKRESLRLGKVRVHLLETGAWQRWDRQRIERSGGTIEQYKHPCLIPDVNFRASLAGSAAKSLAGAGR